MASRVSVDITARDLTRNELARMRQNFRRTGQDLDRMVSNRTRQNLDRLQQSIRATRTDLTRLRGAIPDDEFFRLDNAVRQAQRNLGRGLGRMTQTQLQRIESQVRDVTDSFRDLDRAGDVRVRIDMSAIERADARLDAFRRQQERNAIRVPVNVDIDQMNTLSQRVRRFVLGPWRQTTAIMGGIMSDGIGQGIISGFQVAGPIGMGILAGIIAGAVSVLGAAIAGALVFGFGAAFVGLGVMITKQTGKIKEVWKETVADIKDSFRDVGDPLIPSIEKALGLARKLAADFAPEMKRAMEAAAPALDEFLRKFDSGLRKLGKKAFDPMMEAFDTFIIALGPHLEDFLEEFGKSLGALARTVKANSEEIAMAFTLILRILNFLIDTVNFLANAWVTALHTTIGAIAAVMDAWASLLDTILGAADASLAAIESVAGLIPGMGTKIDEARRNFDLFRQGVVDDLRQSADEIRGVSRTIEEQNRKNILKADIAQLNAKITQAKANLQTVTDKKVQAKIRADINQLLQAKQRAQRELDAINGKTVTTYVITKNIVVGSTAGGIAPGGGGFPSGKATGGITGAATGGVRNNMTLVGEQGPELVNLQPGSHVRSNSDSRRIMSNAGGTGGASQMIFKSSGRRVDDLLLEILREAIHQRGGNPVTVLGG